MVDIRHRVGIKSSVDNLYTALATREGLAAWWTTNTHGDSSIGGTLRFRFSADGRDIGGFDMKVLELQPGRATFLMSLKSLLETGKGQPSPDDVRIGNWH